MKNTVNTIKMILPRMKSIKLFESLKYILHPSKYNLNEMSRTTTMLMIISNTMNSVFQLQALPMYRLQITRIVHTTAMNT